MANSTNAKQYILNMENYPKTKDFEEDIITLMGLSKMGYKDIESKRNDFLKKYDSYYSSYNGHQRMMNYGKFENEGIVTAQGKRTYDASAPGKLDKMIQIFDSQTSDENKVKQMHEIFLTPQDFFDRYKDLYPYFMDTERMKKFADIYAFMNEKKNTFNYEKCNYFDSIKPELELYPEALRVLKKFLVSPCYTISLFCKEENISLHIFDRYIEVIKLLKPDLYITVMEKKIEKAELGKQKQKEQFAANSTMILEIINGIMECQENGEDYDLLEFYKKVPFKYSKENFMAEVFDFVNRNMPHYSQILVNYVYKHKMNYKTKIIPIQYFKINDPKAKMFYGDVEITKDINMALIDYLYQNGYPACENTLRIVRRRFAEGELVLTPEKKISKKLVLEDQE